MTGNDKIAIKFKSLCIVVAVIIVVTASSGCQEAVPAPTVEVPPDVAPVRTAEAPPADTAPSFAATASIADQTYTVGQAVDGLTLPVAMGGNGPLSYELHHSVPGLAYDMATRTLAGTPTTAGTYRAGYQVRDSDDNTDASDADTLSFTISVAGTADSAGHEWRLVPSESQLTLSGVTWNGTRFVAVGQFGTIVHSSDGNRWTAASDSATSSWLQDVTWNGSRFVAVGELGTIVHSSDGDRWTVASGKFGVAWLSGVTWNGSRFVAVGHDGDIFYSSDGDRWSFTYLATSSWLQDVTWNGSRFVAVGTTSITERYDRFIVDPFIFHSSDGDHWTPAAEVYPGDGIYDVFDFHISWEVPNLHSITSNGSRFVAVGSEIDTSFVSSPTGIRYDGVIYRSSDGDHWTERSGPTLRQLYGVTWNGSQFVAVGDAGAIVHSSDGRNWNAAGDRSTPNTLYDVTSNGSRFVAVGDAGTIVVSP